MKPAAKLPPLVAFPAVATGPGQQMLFVRADASFADLWEEGEARTAYARDLADVLASVRYDAAGSPDRALPAFASVVNHLLLEAKVFGELAYRAAVRERAAAGGDA